MKQSRARDPAVIAVLAILAATLLPSGGGGGVSGALCLICGERGLADVLLNIVLFIPLGAALGRRSRRILPPVLAGGLLSLTVELVQLWLPGRDASPADLLANTIGTAIGVAIGRSATYWLNPPRRRARRLAAAALAGAVGTVALCGWLLAPSLPDSVYFGQWTADLGQFETYGGRVTDARVGDLRVAAGRVPSTAALRERLSGGAEVAVDAVAGPAPAALAPIFSIFDDAQREILLVGADGEDAIFRYRTRAAAGRLDRLELRWAGGLRGVAPGERLRIRVRPHGRGYCIEVNGAPNCSIGFTAGAGWGLLYYDEGFPGWLEHLLNHAWLACLFFPAGFWLRRRRDIVLAAGIVVPGLLAVPPLAGLAATPASQLLSGLVGLVLGAWLGRTAQSAAESGPPGGHDPAASTSASRHRSMRA